MKTLLSVLTAIAFFIYMGTVLAVASLLTMNGLGFTAAVIGLIQLAAGIYILTTILRRR